VGVERQGVHADAGGLFLCFELRRLPGRVAHSGFRLCQGQWWCPIRGCSPLRQVLLHAMLKEAFQSGVAGQPFLALIVSMRG
jgi:hypothetical protein